jgi:L,D-transpeptidase ErfK/SrfK
MKKQCRLFLMSALVCLLGAVSAEALTEFSVEPGRTIYGAVGSVTIEPMQTLLDVARDFDLGYNHIVAANPDLDPWTPSEGAITKVPTLFLLPLTRLGEGLIVNLAEMRLYFLESEDGRLARFWTCPVGVGREGFSTELGIYTVLSKVKDPVWVIPPSVRMEDPDLPDEVPPGPENPLGEYILRFSRSAYGIHGTNRPWGVGRRVSHGCIRLYPEDIAALFPLVPVGTLIRITYEPIKIGWGDGACWLQVYEDYEGKVEDPFAEALMGIATCEEVIGPVKIDLRLIKKTLKEQTGIPVPIAWSEELER